MRFHAEPPKSTSRNTCQSCHRWPEPLATRSRAERAVALTLFPQDTREARRLFDSLFKAKWPAQGLR
jgi:hypothetical protein